MFSLKPRFARTAAIFADPSRARMLALLLSGEARSADADGALKLSEGAAIWLRDAGFDEHAIAALRSDFAKKRFAYRCMDWSERREHLAGVFATPLLPHYVETGWLRKDRNSRASTETSRGVGALQKLFANA